MQMGCSRLPTINNNNLYNIYTTKWNKTKLIPSSVFLAIFPHCIVSIISKYVQQTKDLTENVKHLLTLISTGK